MIYNPEIHHRKSIRLKGYDYSKNGIYFITICTNNRENLFGKIFSVGANLRVRPELTTNKIELNNAGKMIEKWLKELPNKYKNIKCDEYVIMPNHIHMLIEICSKEGEHIGSPLHEIIKWFKTMTTNEYIKMVKDGILPSFEKRVWQRNYHENIIRTEATYIKVSDYIRNNPLKWEDDMYFIQI